MKNPLKRRAGEQGSALIITLTFGVILLVVLATYLTLLTSQKNLVTRSQTWNAAMTMAEAGVEEALAQINSAGANATVFSTNGWGGSGVTFGPKSVNLAGGSYSALISMASSVHPGGLGLA